MEIFDDIKERNGEIIDAGFVKWIHQGVPDEPAILRKTTRNILCLLGHCLKCTALSGCYFAKTQTPKRGNESDGLLHELCDCFLLNIREKEVKEKAIAFCAIEKFEEYIFSEKYADNGKKALFEKLGFDKRDSLLLKLEYEKQAREKYVDGQYTLGELNSYGQNINIIINLTNKEGRKIKFVSGWKVYPKGLITCNTPLGG